MYKVDSASKMVFFAPKERSESGAPSELEILNQFQALPGLAKIERSFGAKTPPNFCSESVRNEINLNLEDATMKESASELISKRIAELGDWRGETLGIMRKLIREADPDVVEEWKWMGTPVWSHDGIICTGESYQKVVKLTFAKGAALNDPTGLFNSSLDGNVRRAIDIHEGETVDEATFKALILQAIALNRSKKVKS